MLNRSVSPEKRHLVPPDPAMFSLAESELDYVVAVDIPTIPAWATEISSCNGELTVEGESQDSHERQTIFRMFSQGKGIKAAYMKGVLYLVLPKTQVSLPSDSRIDRSIA